MAREIFVDDPSDPRLDDFRHLRGAGRVRREAERGTVLAEGVQAVLALLSSPYPLRALLCTPARWTRLAPAVAEREVDVLLVRQEVLSEVVGFDLHRGVVACAGRLPPLTPEEVVGGARTVVVVEGVGDPENLGVLFRAARALGADGVLVDPATVDPLYRRCVRVSMGHVLHVPFARTAPLPGGLRPLREAGFQVVALTPDPSAADVGEVAWAGRVALCMGREGPGLSAAMLEAADLRARIPMRPGVDSLNLAAAAAVALYVAGRRG